MSAGIEKIFDTEVKSCVWYVRTRRAEVAHSLILNKIDCLSVR